MSDEVHTAGIREAGGYGHKDNVYHDDGFVAITLYPGSERNDVGSSPDDRAWPFDFYYDADKLARGEREFLGIEVLDVSLITDEWLAELERLDLPRVDVPEADLADVLRWARQTYPSRYTGATA